MPYTTKVHLSGREMNYFIEKTAPAPVGQGWPPFLNKICLPSEGCPVIINVLLSKKLLKLLPPDVTF